MAEIAVLDADVLIAHLDSKDVQHDRARAILTAFVQRGTNLRAGSVTLAEVMVGPAGSDRLAEVKEAISTLKVDEVPMAIGSAPRLAELRAETGCKLPDCCLLLAAEQAGATCVATFDERLRTGAAAIGLEVAEDPPSGPGAGK